jgi:hypothetical protein
MSVSSHHVQIFPHAEQTAGAMPLLPDVMIDPMRGSRKMDSRRAATKDLPQRNHGVEIGKDAGRCADRVRA